MTVVKNTLNAWALVESITPFEMPKNSRIEKWKLKENQPQMQIQHLNKKAVNVWENPAFRLSESEVNKKCQRRYGFYLEVFEKYQIEQVIRKIFGVQEDLINLDKTKCYSFSFEVDETGKMMEKTLTVPLLMYALKYLAEDPTFDAKNIERQYEETFEVFKDIVQEIVVDEPLTAEKLAQIVATYKKYFYTFTEDVHLVNYYKLLTIKDSKKQFQALNSFYLSDLTAAKKDPNRLLEAYISGQAQENKQDIDDDREWIEEILDPEKMPDGRWPSKVAYRLSLMQQVAVNQIATNEEQDIHSVNGPPGTGKTTLLKDVFAWLIVERAKVMSQLKHPKDGFKRKQTKNEGKSIPFLITELAKYKMVVASSNNGAVENISKELPRLEEIVRTDEDSDTYDERYKEAAEAINLFKPVSDELIGEETWGLFSGVMGNYKNTEHYLESIFDPSAKTKVRPENKTKRVNLISRAIKDDTSFNLAEKWATAQHKFHEELEKVQSLKQELSTGYGLYMEARENAVRKEELQAAIIAEQEHKIEAKAAEEVVAAKLNDVQEDIEIEDLLSENRSLFGKMKDFIVGKDNEALVALKYTRKAYAKEQKELRTRLSAADKKMQKFEREIQQIVKENQAFASFKQEFEGKIEIPDEAYWADTKEAYAHRQEHTPWVSDALQFHRGRLFIYAMELHELFLVGNYSAIQGGLYNFKGRSKFLDIDKRIVEQAWNVLHLITPVISTTFASFSRMYEGMGKNFIDYLLIDEAGQAIPQAAVGGLWRSKKAIVVGDPLQIEPVVTLENSLLTQIRNYYGLDERLLSVTNSVQSLADEANAYGKYKTEDQWIGLPLWVHRRCLNPMFRISNTIAYENQMVLPQHIRKDSDGKTGWYDVKGKSTVRQFVPEQAKKVAELLLVDWAETDAPDQGPNVYVITPFTAVKEGIKRIVDRKLKEHFPNKPYKKWVDESIGTVHTFQGKEADKVYFVTGTDTSQESSVEWSASKPNILNVAVTRAKKEFYLIGDYERIKKHDYYQVIAENTEVIKTIK